MDDFNRNNPLFSLCGLNCGLCTMKLGGYCPGCGQGNKPCKTARCGMQHGVEYCFECVDYPCHIYEHADDYDSFITHKNQKSDLEKAKTIGIETYSSEQEEKVKLLAILLDEYNSGRGKTLYSLAVNLLDVEEIKLVIDEANQMSNEKSIKDKAMFVSRKIKELAKAKDIELKLRKKK